MKWSFYYASSLGCPDTCLTSIDLLQNSFLLPLTLNREPCGQSCKTCCLLGLDHDSLLQLHLYKLSVFHFLSLAILNLDLCLYQIELKLGDLPTSAFPMLELKLYPTTPSSKLFCCSLLQVVNLDGWDLARMSPFPLFYFLSHLSPEYSTSSHFLVLFFSS